MLRAASHPMMARARPSTTFPILSAAPPCLPGRRSAAPLRGPHALAAANDVAWSLETLVLVHKLGIEQDVAIELIAKMNERLPTSQQLNGMLTPVELTVAIEKAVEKSVEKGIQNARLEIRIELLLLAIVTIAAEQPGVFSGLLTVMSKYVK